jgi:predicted nucleic acid-binding protein
MTFLLVMVLKFSEPCVMSGKFLFDTNVVIDVLNGRHFVEELETQLAVAECSISVITRMELLSFRRLTLESEEILTNFLTNLAVAPLDEKVENATILLRRATSLKLPDAIIVATAWVGSFILLTSDSKILNLNFPWIQACSPF